MRPARFFFSKKKKQAAQAAQRRVKARKPPENAASLIPSAFAAGKLEVEPLFIVPRFNPIAAGLTLNEPCRMMSRWSWNSGRMTKPQHSGHTLPWGSPPRVPQWRDAGCRPKDTGLPECGHKRRDTALVVGTRDSSTLSTLVEVAGQHNSTEHEARVANE